MNDFLRKFLDAHKLSEVLDLMAMLGNRYNIKWLPVGGRENNLATINLGSDPAAGVIERVTNGIDAVLERQWVESGEPTNLRSPREAVEQWFSIPNGRLVNETDVTKNSRVAKIADKVTVTQFDSDDSNRPTVEIRDLGVGIKASDFSDSILSLNAGRKLKKFFLSGAFGQGGSTAFAYSQYTLIISKSILNPKYVAATIVRFDPGNIDIDKHGVYVYSVDQTTGQPFVFEASEEEFAAGTLVRHIAMDLGKYRGVMTAQTNSLWHLAHHYLFDPILPFRIVEQRDNAVKGERRAVTGNFRLLTQNANTEYWNQATLSFRRGMVTITWWILSAEGDNSQGRINQYTLASKPIIITYNGQKQGELPNTVIKNDLKLPYLEKYIVVHVDCDRLDNEARRQLFPTTRESVRDSSLSEELRALVKETLSGDDELIRLDRERRQRFVQRADNQSVESIKRRLANRIQTFLRDGGNGNKQTIVPQDRIRVPLRPKPPIPVQEPPTMLEISSPDDKKVYPNKRFTLRFRTNAEPSYFSDPDRFIALIQPLTFAEYTGVTNVQNGYGTAYFSLGKAESGETGNITLELRPKKSATLSSMIDLIVAAPPEVEGGGEGQLQIPNVNLLWIDSNNPYWLENQWNDNSVAQVEATGESTEVYVSSENKQLTRLLSKAQRGGVDLVGNIKDFYLEHIAFFALLQKFSESTDTNLEVGIDEAQREELYKRELERASETICGIIHDVYPLMVREAAATTSE